MFYKKSPYMLRLLDPRWQKKRLEVLARSNFSCDECGEKKRTLHVHHRYYISHRMPWEYPDFCYQSLCDECHELVKETVEDNRKEGASMFEEWEEGLDHFGTGIFDVFVSDCQGDLPAYFGRIPRNKEVSK